MLLEGRAGPGRPGLIDAGPAAVVTVDGRALATWDGFHDAMARAFDFPGYYGRNLDAWIDCVSERDRLTVLELDHADDVPAEILHDLVECAAFVNWRRRERGAPAVLLLSFNRSA